MKIAACNEHGKRFQVEFPKNLKCEKLHIDGEVVSSQEIKKCDFAFLISFEGKEKNEKIALIYVELKGQDLKQAILQLESTIATLKDRYKDYKINEAHAVCGKIIPYMTSSAQNSAMKFKKQHGFVLRWHSQSGRLVINN